MHGVGYRKLLVGFLAFLMLGLGLVIVGCAGAEGKQGVQGPPGTSGPPGPLAIGVDREIKLELSVSKPANGTHFVAGETPVITLTVKDQAGSPFDRANDFTQLRLMASGPIETTETTTAVKLLKATDNRSQSVHHYIDLKTNTDVQVSNDKITLTYKLAPISDEKPGTYTSSVWAVSKANGIIQAIATADFQVSTPTVQTQIVSKEKCAQCHLGADSGKFSFAHSDPRQVGQPGNWALDQAAVTICKTCHNNNGYSAYTSPLDGTRVPDPIVNRVHGVHNGEDLTNQINIDPEKGIFRDYRGVVFPADIKNCTYCHADDRWKTQPSRLACGTCHDGVWFGTATAMPTNFTKAHPGGPQSDDTACKACHTSADSGELAIPVVHKIEWQFKTKVELSMTAPANGKFYTAGEKPVVTVTIKDSATGTVINPATIVQPKNPQKPEANEWTRGFLFVSGPRAGTKPVLTTEAEEKNPTAFYAENDLRVHTDPSKEDPRVKRSATAITYQLEDVSGLKPGTYTVFFEMKPPTGYGGWGVLNFQIGTDKEEPKVATNCTECHNDNRQHPEFFAVQYNTDICKSCHDYERQATTLGWALPGGWNGFGAQPLVRKVHGVHFGRYLDNPEDVVLPVLRKPANPNGFDFSETIFPQDVRNCTKCHSANTSGTWKTEPSRLACTACHDSTSALGHVSLMTIDKTPEDSWNGDETETCKVCHGANREFSPDKVHKINNPYVPPYPREPE